MTKVLRSSIHQFIKIRKRSSDFISWVQGSNRVYQLKFHVDITIQHKYYPSYCREAEKGLGQIS